MESLPRSILDNSIIKSLSLVLIDRSSLELNEEKPFRYYYGNKIELYASFNYEIFIELFDECSDSAALFELMKELFEVDLNIKSIVRRQNLNIYTEKETIGIGYQDGSNLPVVNMSRHSFINSLLLFINYLDEVKIFTDLHFKRTDIKEISKLDEFLPFVGVKS